MAIVQLNLGVRFHKYHAHSPGHRDHQTGNELSSSTITDALVTHSSEKKGQVVLASGNIFGDAGAIDFVVDGSSLDGSQGCAS